MQAAFLNKKTNVASDGFCTEAMDRCKLLFLNQTTNVAGDGFCTEAMDRCKLFAFQNLW